MLFYMEWFVSRMKDTFNIEVNEDEVSIENYDFYHDELDELLVSLEHLEKLPNPVLFETLSYVDDEGIEWIAGLVMNEETKEKMYEVWIKNGEKIAYEIYVE